MAQLQLAFPRHSHLTFLYPGFPVSYCNCCGWSLLCDSVRATAETKCPITACAPVAVRPYGMEEEEEIVRSEDISDRVSNVELSIDVTADMSPTFSILLFYIRDDGETVADSMQFKVQPCFDNEVSLCVCVCVYQERGSDVGDGWSICDHTALFSWEVADTCRGKCDFFTQDKVEFSNQKVSHLAVNTEMCDCLL